MSTNDLKTVRATKLLEEAENLCAKHDHALGECFNDCPCCLARDIKGMNDCQSDIWFYRVWTEIPMTKDSEYYGLKIGDLRRVWTFRAGLRTPELMAEHPFVEWDWDAYNRGEYVDKPEPDNLDGGQS